MVTGSTRRVTFRSEANHRSHNTALIFEWSSVHTHAHAHTRTAMHPPRCVRSSRYSNTRIARYRSKVVGLPRENELDDRLHGRRAQWRNLHGCKRFSFHASYAGMTGPQSGASSHTTAGLLRQSFRLPLPLPLFLVDRAKTLFARLFLPPVIYPGMHHHIPRVCPAAATRRPSLCARGDAPG